MRRLLNSALILLLPTFGLSQINLEMQNLVHDVYKLAQSEDKTHTIYTFWFPVDFWELSTAGHPQVAKEDLNRMKAALENYLLLAISEVDNSQGFLNYTLRDELQQKISVTNSNNQLLERIEINDLPHDAYLAVRSFDATLEQLFGKLGRELEFMVYDISQCLELFDPRAPSGSFLIQVGEYDIEFTLPLGSFLPMKKCPLTNELYNGKWNYCPIHGQELIAQ